MTVYIETERLILRTATPEDADVLALRRSSDFVMKYNLYRPSSAEDLLREMDFSEYIVLALREGGGVIGCLSVKEDDFRYHVDSVSIEAWLSEEYARKGYMHEAFSSMLEHLFCTRLHERVSARIMEGNIASIRLVEKLGFEREGCLRRGVRRYDGSVLDVYLYSIDRQYYLENHKSLS